MADVERERTGRGDGLFAPISVARASSSIADQIRQAIVSGKLTEGERLAPERELAEQFGVSRVTVRDALRGLEAMGLIEVRVGARGGAFVTVPSGAIVGQTMSDMMMMSALTPEDVVEARLIVELGTVTLAFFFGVLYTYFLTETGPRMKDLNFLWCAQQALVLLFIVSASIELTAWRELRIRKDWRGTFTLCSPRRRTTGRLKD